MKRILLASILTLACIGASTPALAHGHGHHRGNCQGNCADRDCNGNCGKTAVKKQRGKQNKCPGGNCGQQQSGAQKRNQQGQQK